MKAIVVVDRNWGIGKENRLLVHLAGDLKYFKEKTFNKVVVMGRETFESLPGKKPLPNRTNLILSRNPDFYAENCIVCRSMGQLFKQLEHYDRDDVMIAGGENIYKQFLPYCSGVLVTKIDGVFEADRHFVNLDLRDDFSLVHESASMEENGVSYKFTEYRRK